MHNNNGGTASVPPNLTTQSRTAQNTSADMRRLMAEHHAEVPSSDSAQEPIPAQEITVAQAFIQHSTAQPSPPGLTPKNAAFPRIRS